MTRNRPLLTCARVVGLGLAIQSALAQDAKCYYPNGEEAPEKPCSSAEGSACCPDKWQCLDNGLCHYPADNLFGRYSCTDQKWEADGCPSNLCTYDMTAFGGESITQCKDHDNQWCCNADATHVDCCKESPEPRPFFDLAEGKAYATVGSEQANEAPNLASITGSATGGGGGDSPSQTSGPSDSPSDTPNSSSGGSSNSASPTPTGPTTPVTSLQTSVTSGPGGASTLIITSIIQPTSEPSNSNPSQSSGGSNSKVPIIVGCAVGIPLALALIGILLWLLRKRHNQNKNEKRPFSATPDPYANGAQSPEFAGGAKLHKPQATTYKSEDAGVAELPGQGVGPGRPISTIKGMAELESGGGFAPGAVPHAPHLVGVGGGNGVAAPQGQGQTPNSSWGSAPPGYSPGMNQQAWAAGAQPQQQASVELPAQSTGGGGGAVAAGTPAGMNVAPGGGNAPHTEGGRYIPYRPPPGHMRTATGGAGGGRTELQNVPELSAVRTPP